MLATLLNVSPNRNHLFAVPLYARPFKEGPDGSINHPEPEQWRCADRCELSIKVGILSATGLTDVLSMREYFPCARALTRMSSFHQVPFAK